MKPLISLILALAMALSLMACAGPAAPEAAASQEPSPSQTPEAPAQVSLIVDEPQEDSQEPEATQEAPAEATEPPAEAAQPEATEPSAEAAQPEAIEPPAETAQPEAIEPPAEAAQPEAIEPPVEAAQPEAGSNILIAYFTWAENTVVEDPSTIDVDATTSASVLLPGNAAKMAGWIQETLGGDLFSMVVEEPYSSDYDQCLDRASEEKADDARPALVNHLDNVDDYDVVFIGFPNWWYTLPMAVLTFVEEYNFEGKTIVPFVTHGTGGLASTIDDLRSALPDSVTILEPIGVYRPEVDESQDEVVEWARSLDLG